MGRQYGCKYTKNGVTPDDWLTDDGLLLLKSWTRDGNTLVDIANRIGIDHDQLLRWRDKYPEMREAMSQGKELVDYQVENALLKSALGFKTKEVKVTTLMRYGKVVETTKEVLEKEMAPNVSAIQMWLYNRNKDKWKNMNAAKNMFEDMEEDTSIEITVTRAGKDETTNGDAPSHDDGIEDKDITLRKRTKEEKAAIDKAKKEEKKKAKATTYVEEDEEDLDEWPDDWEDEDEE